MMSGYTAQAIPSIRADKDIGFILGEQEINWISKSLRTHSKPFSLCVKTQISRHTQKCAIYLSGSIVPLAAVCAAPLSSPLCSLLGRRRTMMVACLPMFLGWILVTYAQANYKNKHPPIQNFKCLVQRIGNLRAIQFVFIQYRLDIATLDIAQRPRCLQRPQPP